MCIHKARLLPLVLFFILISFFLTVQAQGQQRPPIAEKDEYTGTLLQIDLQGDGQGSGPFTPGSADARDRTYTIYVAENLLETHAGQVMAEAYLPYDYVNTDRACFERIEGSSEEEWMQVSRGSGRRNNHIILTLSQVGDSSEAKTSLKPEIGGEKVSGFNIWQDPIACGAAPDDIDNAVTLKFKSVLYNHYEEPKWNKSCSSGGKVFDELARINPASTFSARSCFDEDGAYIASTNLTGEPDWVLKSRVPGNTRDLLVGISEIPEVTDKRGIHVEDTYPFSLEYEYCTGKIQSADHSACEPESGNESISITVNNIYDEPIPTSNASGCNANVTGCTDTKQITVSNACFDGNPVPTLSQISFTLSSGSATEVTASNKDPLGAPRTSDPLRVSYTKISQQGACTTSQEDEDDVVITFDIETDPPGLAKSQGSRVQSITFSATDNKIDGATSWRKQKIYKNQDCGSFPHDWDNLPESYTEGTEITLGSANDNGYTYCFASRKSDTNIDYESVDYHATIDTTYNRDIRFFVGQAPSATISGTAEPGATVTVVSAESNDITIALGGNISTIADRTTGAWSMTIPNAVDQDQDTNLVVVTTTRDGFLNEIEQTHRTTIDGSTEEPPVTTTDGDDTETENPSGDTDSPPASTDTTATDTGDPSPFTIRADKSAISEGESIEWTVARRESVTVAEDDFTISCEERGAWGTTPLEFTGSGAGSFTTKTADDDTPEPPGSITCSVLGSGSTASDSYSVRVISGDQVEKSNLIIDCTFGPEEDTVGNPKEQCGIEHLFELANNIMKLLLWLAITGAGILIFYRGAVLAINVFVKGGDQEARKKVKDALRAVLFGLIFILSAYLIVKAGFNIIGYNLGDPFKWNEAKLPDAQYRQPGQQGTSGQPPADNDGDDDTEPPANEPTTETAQCPQRGGGTAECTCTSCVIPAGGITFKNNKKMHTGLGSNLEKLKDKTSNLTSWTVTEAWPPTPPGHRADCHYVGTCVDIAFRENGSPIDYTKITTPAGKTAYKEAVKTFIEKARESGLVAVFETPHSDVAKSVKDNGMQALHDSRYVDHFSVYDCNLPSPPANHC